MRYLFVKLLLFLMVPVCCSIASADQSSLNLAAKSRYYGEVIFIRGGFNVFSRGLDEMSAALEKSGIKSRVFQHTEAEKITTEIITNQKKYGRKPIVLVGHSWGANALIRIAESLKKKRLRVNYAATFAATAPDPVPKNIRKLTNYYFKSDGWGKPIIRKKGFRGILKNIDVSKYKEIHHFNIEKQRRLQNQVLKNIIRVLRIKRLG